MSTLPQRRTNPFAAVLSRSMSARQPRRASRRSPPPPHNPRLPAANTDRHTRCHGALAQLRGHAGDDRSQRSLGAFPGHPCASCGHARSRLDTSSGCGAGHRRANAHCFCDTTQTVQDAVCCL
ncbi:hypothetical protein TW95_gp0041 [Pandoravirus inopinatum]|uniref:Uncharacterized protein n=1 Tax=Pandoravirus inopinatum TaxID=1605721 RepID=A0A0B5J576_9VIRU|nr:hypothetical protein TW95_gp0041 [Pandoravirus inopinatum]AJF96775.1 hypothetical protein [Pandoravirus inopinatum]